MMGLRCGEKRQAGAESGDGGGGGDGGEPLPARSWCSMAGRDAAAAAGHRAGARRARASAAGAAAAVGVCGVQAGGGTRPPAQLQLGCRAGQWARRRARPLAALVDAIGRGDSGGRRRGEGLGDHLGERRGIPCAEGSPPLVTAAGGTRGRPPRRHRAGSWLRHAPADAPRAPQWSPRARGNGGTGLLDGRVVAAEKSGRRCRRPRGVVAAGGGGGGRGW